MARAGRKRKPRGFSPGRKSAKPVERVDKGTPEIRARRAERVALAHIQAWDGTELHALYLNRDIDRGRYEAGRRFAALSKLYLGMIAAPNPDAGPGTPKSRSERFVDPEAYQRVKDRYCDAYCALGGHREQRAVAGLVREEPYNLAAAKKGLNNLAQHFR